MPPTLAELERDASRNAVVVLLSRGDRAYNPGGAQQQRGLAARRALAAGAVVGFMKGGTEGFRGWLNEAAGSALIAHDMAIEVKDGVCYVDRAFVSCVYARGRAAVTERARYQWYALNNPSRGGSPANVKLVIRRRGGFAFLVWVTTAAVPEGNALLWTYNATDPFPFDGPRGARSSAVSWAFWCAVVVGAPVAAAWPLAFCCAAAFAAAARGARV